MPRKTRGATGTSSEATAPFNEAAARCRGKPYAPRREISVPLLPFNEAAARCRGKPSMITHQIALDPNLQ